MNIDLYRFLIHEFIYLNCALKRGYHRLFCALFLCVSFRFCPLAVRVSPLLLYAFLKKNKKKNNFSTVVLSYSNEIESEFAPDEAPLNIEPFKFTIRNVNEVSKAIEDLNQVIWLAFSNL